MQFRQFVYTLWVILLVALPAPACKAQSTGPVSEKVDSSVLADTTFARLLTSLSEQGGYFDTDNLISNETSYLHAIDGLRAHAVQGGAYLGVGPDQNFSYMAQVRPEIAFMVDIRRDNQLQHLFFKALFQQSPDRITYLCLLFGKRLPPDTAAWEDRTVVELVTYLEQADKGSEVQQAVRQRVAEAVRALPVSLSEQDHQTIAAIHRRFMQGGLALQFNSHNRSPQYYYPTYRDLLLETDRSGQQQHFLVTEQAYQFLRTMQQENRIIPLVGNLAGPSALRRVGQWLRQHDMAVSTFYTSNVEFYLMRSGTFDRFAQNVAALPVQDSAMIIRSYFNRFSGSHPQSLPGYASTQLVQPVSRFMVEYEAGVYRSYGDLLASFVR